MTVTTDVELVWEPPGKGDWRGLHDHFPRALTPIYRDLLAQGMEQGEAIWFADYGLPARTVAPAFVHGRVFISAMPLIGSPSDRLPPAWAMKVAARVVPAFRRRATAADRALAERRWLGEATRWYEVDRPGWIERNGALDAIDPGALGDAELVAHLRAVHANAQAGYLDHFRLHGTDLMPTGMFLGRAVEWGIDPIDAAALLAGWSPASRGDRALPAWRMVTGYDLDERTAAELPARAPCAPRETHRPGGAEARELRERVPAGDRDEWDRLLDDARATYGVRDDNGMLTAAWPVGLLRRAVLEIGRRLVARGRLHRPEHAVELTFDELVSVHGPVAGAAGVDPDDAESRLAERRAVSRHPAPASLGPALDVPVDALPDAMRTMAQALFAIRELGTTQVGEREPLRGIGIGTNPVVGRACVATDPAVALSVFEPGDILITAGTTPAWNTVLALAGGIVTEEGGPLSHAAVIARELALPALVGCADAVALIPDGATVELDPVRGSVRVIADSHG